MGKLGTIGGKVRAHSRILKLGGVGLTATSLLAACGSTAASASSSNKSPIVIGVSLPLTGDFSADGIAFEQGYKLWQANVNANGGILGRKVQLKIISDNSDPAQATTDYQQLITSDHVNMVFGPFSTLLTIPSARIANRYGYAMIEGAGGGPSVFQQGLHNVFDVSAPVADALVPFANWIAKLPASERPKTAAYPTSNDPFTQPQVVLAQKILQKAGVKTVYSKAFGSEVTDFTPIASQVAASNAQIVILGSVDVPTVSAFIQDFAQQHYNPKALIATGGPDQGQAFLTAVGKSNANGVMVPNTWYPGAKTPGSQAMVKAYLAKYGGSASQISADIAEAYSVGQIAADAIRHTGGTNQAKIIKYLHSGVTLSSVQGNVKFNSLGENTAALMFGFEWVNGTFKQVLPLGDAGSSGLLFPKPNWGA